MTLGGVTAFAAEETVRDAATLQEAIVDGNTIVLDEDITASITIPQGVSITLDLNGHKLTNEQGKHTITNNGTLVVKGKGTVDNVDVWGKRKLAYEINGLTDGDYTLIDFHANPENVAELDRVLRITDAVVRHMIVKRTDRD